MIHYTDERVTLHHGDCLDVLRELPDASVDAVVTDPPYALEFMGRGWDRFTPLEFERWCESWATECYRVLKPGGHLLAFGGSRTWHRLAAGVEDAGFEMRDSIAWLYGSGFPKSLDVGKALDKAAGAEREVIGRAAGAASSRTVSLGVYSPEYDATAPATDLARQWHGWGTALKPAFEPVVVARKPLAGTVAANVTTWGTGALNVDGCRVGTDLITAHGGGQNDSRTYGMGKGIPAIEAGSNPHMGRWPTNVVLTHAYDCGTVNQPGRCVEGCPVRELDQQSGVLTSGANPTRRGSDKFRDAYGEFAGQEECTPARGADQGGASRFFPTFRYEAKAPSIERPRVKVDGAGEGRVIGRTVKRCATCGSKTIAPGAGSGPACGHGEWENVPIESREEHVAHPTVKPLDLMRWLVRLVTPPGGTVLEPFAGSGTTAEACVIEGMHCIAVEREADYLPLIVARLSKPIELDLFGGVA